MYLYSFIKSIGRLTLKTFSGLKQSEKWARAYLHTVEVKFDGKFICGNRLGSDFCARKATDL